MKETIWKTQKNKIFRFMFKKYDEGNGTFIRGRTTMRMFCCKNVLDFLTSIL